ncbi:ATP-binding protein [Propionimicrobium sp. PCR01-08-3]|uniref:ATP-binding protein n=1 Tax=Propionimicrobium sp. PCR01-08-3 TaxID=3052086 RepID=UPI00255CD1AE|nr:ATP-binding protein [Propionimicrobium sp. PCR01-08-3]WIY82311.1 ATP-binding protein [Propionimicrobium sp. PCR01-08-3]
MIDASPLLERRVTAVLSSRLLDEPVVALHGPRSVGKSTVLRSLASSCGVEIIDLDDVDVREAVAGNLSLIGDGQIPLCIDEYQRVPDVLDAIKARLNREGSQPGIAIITGSTRQDALPMTAQALTGRVHSMVLWPMSQGEMAGVTENLIEELRICSDSVVAQHSKSGTSREDYVARVCAGGFPLAVRRSDAARARWFDDYLRQSIERDATKLLKVRQRQSLADLVTYVAAQTGQLLNITKAAESIGVERKTAEAHLRLLEDLFLVSRLPAWGKTLRSRVSARPKAHVVDSGLAARLLRLTPAKLGSLDPAPLTEFGNLLETFVVGEIRKQTSWLEEPVVLGHWRTSDGAEVDLVIEFEDGTVVAFEVKANQRATAPDFKGLQQLRAALGSHFAAGIVLTTGQRSFTYDDRIHVMPIDRLWTPVKHRE